MQLEQPPLQRVPPRVRFPTELLHDEDATANLQHLLLGLGEASPQNVLQLLERVTSLIQEQGVIWRRMSPRTGHLPLQRILQMSSPGKVAPQG